MPTSLNFFDDFAVDNHFVMQTLDSYGDDPIALVIEGILSEDIPLRSKMISSLRSLFTRDNKTPYPKDPTTITRLLSALRTRYNRNADIALKGSIISVLKGFFIQFNLSSPKIDTTPIIEMLADYVPLVLSDNPSKYYGRLRDTLFVMESYPLAALLPSLEAVSKHVGARPEERIYAMLLAHQIDSNAFFDPDVVISSLHDEQFSRLGILRLMYRLDANTYAEALETLLRRDNIYRDLRQNIMIYLSENGKADPQAQALQALRAAVNAHVEHDIDDPRTLDIAAKQIGSGLANIRDVLDVLRAKFGVGFRPHAEDLFYRTTQYAGDNQRLRDTIRNIYRPYMDHADFVDFRK